MFLQGFLLRFYWILTSSDKHLQHAEAKCSEAIFYLQFLCFLPLPDHPAAEMLEMQVQTNENLVNGYNWPITSWESL